MHHISEALYSGVFWLGGGGQLTAVCKLNAVIFQEEYASILVRYVTNKRFQVVLGITVGVYHSWAEIYVILDFFMRACSRHLVNSALDLHAGFSLIEP